MKLDDLHPNEGSRREKRRIGRGHGSGRGKTAGRGTKGQLARSGGGWNPRFEGGQTPLHLRLPHRRGFKNPFRVEYAIVKLGDLDRFEGDATVTRADLEASGLVHHGEKRPLKLLANGDLGKAIHLEAIAFTRAARTKLEAAGGSIAGAPPLEVEAADEPSGAAGTSDADLPASTDADQSL